MAVLVQRLEGKARNLLHSTVVGIFLDGECYAFAIALHRALGWPIYGLATEDHSVRHACVRTPHGKYFDARGEVSDKDLGRPFSAPEPLTLRPITEETLEAVRPVHERTIVQARHYAEMLWPDLPWPDSFSAQVSAFLAELEILSDKHRVWIRSPYPASRPVLSRSMGDEQGYEATPTEDGSTFVFDRVL